MGGSWVGHGGTRTGSIVAHSLEGLVLAGGGVFAGPVLGGAGNHQSSSCWYGGVVGACWSSVVHMRLGFG